MEKCALWLRVSTEEQTTENQRLELEEMASLRGLEIAKIYDVSASAFQGAHDVVLQQVYRDARANRFKYLLIWSLDRLSRQGIGATFEIMKSLSDVGVQLISLREDWVNVSGPLRELLLSIFSWVAQQESTRRSERTKSGMARARAKGTHVGRPKGSTDNKTRRRRPRRPT